MSEREQNRRPGHDPLQEVHMKRDVCSQRALSCYNHGRNGGSSADRDTCCWENLYCGRYKLSTVEGTDRSIEKTSWC